MLRNILNKINSLEFRDKITLFLVIGLIGLAVWNCYLSSKLQLVEGMSATNPNTAIQNLAKLSSYISSDGNSFTIP